MVHLKPCGLRAGSSCHEQLTTDASGAASRSRVDSKAQQLVGSGQALARNGLGAAEHTEVDDRWVRHAELLEDGTGGRTKGQTFVAGHHLPDYVGVSARSKR